MSEEQLADLMLQWEERRLAGLAAAAVELCHDCPELARRIDVVESMEGLLDVELVRSISNATTAPRAGCRPLCCWAAASAAASASTSASAAAASATASASAPPSPPPSVAATHAASSVVPTPVNTHARAGAAQSGAQGVSDCAQPAPASGCGPPIRRG